MNNKKYTKKPYNKKNNYRQNNRKSAEELSNIEILKSGVTFIQDKNANKKINNEIDLSDNIKQKIKAINYDYESHNDQAITGNIENAISSLAQVLHRVYAALPGQSGFKGPVVTKAYDALKSEITYPGTAFEFLLLIIKEFNDDYLKDQIIELRKKTKSPGDRGRHTNFDSDNNIDQIVVVYNDVIDEIALYTKLSAIKKYEIEMFNKSFHCPICKKGFSSRQALNDHMYHMHTTEGQSKNTNNSKNTKKHKEKVKTKKIDPETAKKRSGAKKRIIISSIVSILISIVLIIVLTVRFDVRFVTALWISLIVLYACFGYCYELFPKKLLHLYFAFYIGRLSRLHSGISEIWDNSSYFGDKVAAFLLSLGFYLILCPLTFIFAAVTGVVIPAITIIPVVLIDMI